MKSLSFITPLRFLLVANAMLLFAGFVSAWTGPTSSPPNGNVPAPVNVGTTDQVKDAGLSVNELTVFGSEYVQNKLGINAQPVFALDVNGSMRLGNGGELCQSVAEGAQRYNSATKQMEFCDGTSWKAIGGRTGALVAGQNIYTTSGDNTYTIPIPENAEYAQIQFTSRNSHSAVGRTVEDELAGSDQFAVRLATRPLVDLEGGRDPSPHDPYPPRGNHLNNSSNGSFNRPLSSSSERPREEHASERGQM